MKKLTIEAITHGYMVSNHRQLNYIKTLCEQCKFNSPDIIKALDTLIFGSDIIAQVMAQTILEATDDT